MCTHLNNFLLWSADDNYTLLHGTQTMHRGEETDGWIPVDGLVPFSNYTVQVNVSNSQGSLISDPVMIAMPPGGKSLHSTGRLNVCKRPRTKSPWNTWFVVSIIIIIFLQLLSCVSGCLGGGCVLWRPLFHLTLRLCLGVCVYVHTALALCMLGRFGNAFLSETSLRVKIYIFNLSFSFLLQVVVCPVFFWDWFTCVSQPFIWQKKEGSWIGKLYSHQ